MVPGTRVTVADPLGPVGCKVGPPPIGLVPALSTNVKLKLYLGNLEPDRVIHEQILRSQGALSCWGSLPSGSAAAMRACTRSATAFE